MAVSGRVDANRRNGEQPLFLGVNASYQECLEISHQGQMRRSQGPPAAIIC
jgi:hypothetical protein